MTVRGAVRGGAQVMAWSVILGVSAVLTLAVLVPRLAGATPYVVLTGSMQPGMPPGTLVVVRPVEPEEIETGTVITYQLRSGEPTVVTHRVTSVGVTAAGELSFGTQGDANAEPDAQPVRPVQIQGERWYHVPYLGYVTSFLTGGQRRLGTFVVSSALLGYAAAMFLSAARDRRRARAARKERHGQAPQAAPAS